MVDSHKSDAYRQKTTLLHSPEFFSLNPDKWNFHKKYMRAPHMLQHEWSSCSLLNTRVTLQMHICNM